MNESLPGLPGDIRAFDVRTGAAALDVPHDSASRRRRLRDLAGDAWRYTAAPTTGRAWRSTRNAASCSSPPARPHPISTAPTGIGDNLFANCLLALEAATGKRVWHFQAVHHDIWDRDFPSPPTLVTVRQTVARRRRRSADHQARLRLLFDRETGAPLFPVDSKPFPASNVPGERASRTQPVPRLARAVRAPAPDRGPADETARPSRPRLGRGRSRTCKAGPFTLCNRQGHGRVPGVRWRRRMGRQRLRPRPGAAVRQRQRPRRGPGRSRPTTAAPTGRAST